MNPLAIILAAGGTLYVTGEADKDKKKDKKKPAKPKKTYAALAAMKKPTLHTAFKGATGVQYTSVVSNKTSGNQYPQEVIDELERRAVEEFKKLTASAKREACKKLKAQYPNSPNVQALPCDNATLEAVITAVSIAAGTALCGPTCGALAAICATYFAADLSDWINDSWNDVMEWTGADGDVCTGTAGLLGFRGEKPCQAWKRTGKDWGQWMRLSDKEKDAWNNAND